MLQHEVAISDVNRAQLAALPAEWTKFKAVIQEAAVSLDDAKENFRERVRGMVDAFSAEVNTISETFAATAPFSNVGHATVMVCTALLLDVLYETRCTHG
ncbi:MAG: hypothetical protein HC852_18980 [Acaryochloridaceae cyanobacterium RU_4_10]|nr:hypothetical protein [Acaryochloridaceae cyanobacterium RU_4_10]